MCLYAAKRHGRNRVMSEIDPEVTASGAAAAQVALINPQLSPASAAHSPRSRRRSSGSGC